jgi:hypothetical protein
MRKRVPFVKQIVDQSIRLNAILLISDLVILTVYSVLEGLAFLSLLTGGSLAFLFLLEAGILFLGGGAYVMTSGVSFGKFRERVFHSEGWSPEDLRRSEVRALPWVVAGALVFVESLALSMVWG